MRNYVVNLFVADKFNETVGWLMQVFLLVNKMFVAMVLSSVVRFHRQPTAADVPQLFQPWFLYANGLNPTNLPLRMLDLWAAGG